MPRTTSFKTEWLSNPEYKGWLRKNSMTEAMCTYCFNHVFSIANMGESAIKSHAKGIRHKLRCPKASMLTPKGSIVDSPSSSTCSLSSETNSPVATAVSPTTIVPANSTTNTQRLIVDSLVKDNVLLAEMRWCLHVVMEKHSFHFLRNRTWIFVF